MVTMWVDYRPTLGEDGLMRCVSRDGSTVVEVIRLSCSEGRDGEWLRVKRHGFHLADVRSVEELARLGVDLPDLAEAELLARLAQGRGRLWVF
jgi:hypothetical protein